MSNFSDILNQQPSETERPKPLPVGSYICTVAGLPRLDKSAKKGTPFAEFILKFQSAGEDVDEDDLNSALNGKPLSEKTTRATYYLTEDALWRLKQFLEHCGIDMDDRSYAECLNDAPNCQIGIYLKHTPSDDGESMYANIAKTFKVE